MYNNNLFKSLLIATITISINHSVFSQQREYYEQARDALRSAASKTKCQDRATYLNNRANFCDCMVRRLAGENLSCTEPTGDVPACPEDSENSNNSSTNPATASSQNNLEHIEQLSSLASDDVGGGPLNGDFSIGGDYGFYTLEETPSIETSGNYYGISAELNFRKKEGTRGWGMKGIYWAGTPDFPGTDPDKEAEQMAISLIQLGANYCYCSEGFGISFDAEFNSLNLQNLDGVRNDYSKDYVMAGLSAFIGSGYTEKSGGLRLGGSFKISTESTLSLSAFFEYKLNRFGMGIYYDKYSFDSEDYPIQDSSWITFRGAMRFPW